MATIILCELLFTKVGTNQIKVRVDEEGVWFTILGTGDESDPFFKLSQHDWDNLKKFVDFQTSNPINNLILPTIK